MQSKYPEDFRAKDLNWSDYMNNSNGLLSQIVESTTSDKSNSEIYKKTKDSIKNFEEYVNHSNPKIGKIVTAEDFQRLFRGDISEQVLAESFGLVTGDGKPLGESIELLIAKRLAKMQKGIVSAENSTLRKTNISPGHLGGVTAAIGQGPTNFIRRRGIGSSGHSENFVSPSDRVAPISPTYDVIDPDSGVVHTKIKKQSVLLQLIGRISANLMPFGAGHVVETITNAASNSLTETARNSGADPETARIMLGKNPLPLHSIAVDSDEDTNPAASHPT